MNNIKLYTEEQVIEMLEGIDILSDEGIFYYRNKMTPIELPSDEEIEELMNKNGYYEEDYDNIWREGAKWMKEQIINQNK